MLRFALLQLNNLEESLGNQADGSFANITSLLQVSFKLTTSCNSIGPPPFYLSLLHHSFIFLA